MGRWGWMLVGIVLWGCTEPPPPTDGDAVPERLFSRDALLDEFRREADWYVSPVLEARTGATRAGFLLTTSEEAGEGMPIVEARGFDQAGDAGEWVRVEVTWAEATQRVARVDLGMVAYAAQMRVHAADVMLVEDVLWSAVVPVPHEELGAEPVPEIAGRSEALRSELRDLVNTRGSWGARSPVCSSSDPSKYRMAIHHTVTPATGDIPTRLRGIQNFHIDTRGWCDVGYHFLVSLDGQLWEGRELSSLGTHVGGNNSGNIGISFIGCFQDSGCNGWTPSTPPDAMINAAAALVSRLSGLYGIDVNSSTVKGHRDHSGATTSCPGGNLYGRLDEIRAGASTPVQFAAEYVSQSFPLARDPYPVPAGTEDEGYIELRNAGAATWRPGETFLGTTEPRDGESAIAASDWVSPSRAATVDREVPPGETGRFVFSVRAPEAPGEYPQYFTPVQEGVAWFSDPGQGGPPDNQLQVRVESHAWDAGPQPVDAGVEPVADAAVPARADGGPAVHVRPEATPDDGCGCQVPGRTGGNGWWGTLALVGLLVLRRRGRGILAAWRR